MRKYSPTVNLLIALVAVVIIGSSLDIIDLTFGTRLSAASGIWFAITATVLLIAFVVTAFKGRK